MNKVIVMPRATSGVVNVNITNEASARAPPPTNKPKWGAGSFSAWMRQGLKELRSLIYPQSPHSRDAELGMWGTATPHEVWNSRTKQPALKHKDTKSTKENDAVNNPNQAVPEQEQSHSTVDDRVAQAQAEQEHQQQQEKGHEKE